jgi:hypothetical protein
MASRQCWAEAENGESLQLFEAGRDVKWLRADWNQNMDWNAVVQDADGLSYFRWYDSSIDDYTVTTYEGLTTPVVVLDDKRAGQSGRSDVLLIYLKGERLYYRQQRDRYNTEYYLGSQLGATGIGRAGMSDLARLQLEILKQGGNAPTGRLCDAPGRSHGCEPFHPGRGCT